MKLQCRSGHCRLPSENPLKYALIAIISFFSLRFIKGHSRIFGHFGGIVISKFRRCQLFHLPRIVMCCFYFVSHVQETSVFIVRDMVAHFVLIETFIYINGSIETVSNIH